MWGEIDPPDKTSSSDGITRTPDTSPEPQPETHTPRTVLSSGKESTSGSIREPLQTNQSLALFQAVSDFVGAMVEAIAVSGSLVKSQQIGEAELTLDQRRVELLQQYKSKPLVFLERYQAHLKPQHLPAFSHLGSEPRAQHYCRVIQRRAEGHSDRTRVRNQRYAALRALQREGQYFSEEQMRVREPLLYEQYIGQYLTDEEIVERSQEAMQEGAQGGPGCSEGATGGLAHILLNSYQERLIQSRLEEEQEKEECAREEDEDEEGDDDRTQQGGWEPGAEEKALLRGEFISQMHQRFLDGKDKDFNYSEVDENPDYDNLDIVSRDEEEKYFDEDDDEEEEVEYDDDDDDVQQKEGRESPEEEKMTE